MLKATACIVTRKALADLNILLIIFMAATLAVLVTGIVVMVKGGDTDRKLSNKLMVARVWFQAITICIVLLVLYLGKK